MDRFLLLRPKNGTEATINKAIEKYRRIFVAEASVTSVPNSSAAATALEQRPHVAVFIDELVPREDLGTLMAAFLKLRRPPQLVVAKEDNRKVITASVPQHMKASSFLIDGGEELTATFVYDCVRSLLASDQRKIDMRIFRSIITSVINVIESNTQTRMVPGKMLETKPKFAPRELSGSLAFSGDGIQGNLYVSTSCALVRWFTANIFGDQSNNEGYIDLLQDFLAEMTNQVFGVVKGELVAFGYEFTPSTTLVVGGPRPHFFESKSPGNYYVMPFSYEGQTMEIVFCYEMTPINLSRSARTEAVPEAKGDGIFDVRLVNILKNIVVETISANGNGVTPHLIAIKPQRAESDETGSMHILHGWHRKGGGYTLGLMLPFETAGFIVESMMGMGRADLEPDVINDAIGELANQIGSNFRKSANALEYNYPHIFHCNYCGISPIRLINKSRGLHMRLEFELESRPFAIQLSMDRSLADPAFNLNAFFQRDKALLLKQPTVPSEEIANALALGPQFAKFDHLRSSLVDAPAARPVAGDAAATADAAVKEEEKPGDVDGLLF